MNREWPNKTSKVRGLSHFGVSRNEEYELPFSDGLRQLSPDKSPTNFPVQTLVR